MPYSMNPDENRENAHSPSFLSMQDQFIYRLASLEATVNGSFRRLDEKFTDMATLASNDRLEAAKVLAAFETRVTAIEKWQTAMAVRASGIASIIVVIWMIFGDYVRKLLGTSV